jgi:hypothetical protein
MMVGGRRHGKSVISSPTRVMFTCEELALITLSSEEKEEWSKYS